MQKQIQNSLVSRKSKLKIEPKITILSEVKHLKTRFMNNPG